MKKKEDKKVKRVYLADLREDKHIGRTVIFKAYFSQEPQEGKIISWNDRFVFISFKGEESQACSTEHLTWK